MICDELHGGIGTIVVRHPYGSFAHFRGQSYEGQIEFSLF